jgi:hypothetical protein
MAHEGGRASGGHAYDAFVASRHRADARAGCAACEVEEFEAGVAADS